MPKTHTPAGDVISPRQHLTLVKVIHDGGKDKHSVAIVRWENEPALALRWNGTEGSPIGHPQSRGLPTWFIVPGDYQEAIIDTFPIQLKSLAKTLLQ